MQASAEHTDLFQECITRKAVGRGMTDVPERGASPHRGNQEVHEIRITSHGKLQGWVEFALDFFVKNEAKALTFHTLSAAASSALQDNGDNALTAQELTRKQSLALVPRLISVVEIVKREYLKKLDASLAEKGALSGLFQYNELVNAGDPETRETRATALALGGKNHPKLQKRNAYVRITLSRTQLHHFATKPGVTIQNPSVRKLSKTAKARAKRRMKQHLGSGSHQA